MSETDTSLVDELQSLEYDYVDVERLEEHPVNPEVYGEVDPDESFVNDIERNGVETPLIANDHEDCPDTVIGGHRRLEGAKRAGLKRVPVRWVSYPEPMATRRVILNNNQRNKSPGQQTREALVLERTARQVAKENQKVEGNQHTGQIGLRQNSDEAQRWDEDVAEQVGVSRDTIRNGTDVYRIAYPDKYVHDELRNPEKYDVPDEVREVARQQVRLMDEDEQSFHGAYKAVKDAKRKTRVEQAATATEETLNEKPTVGSVEVERGQTWKLGRHLLYCGDSASNEFRELTKSCPFAFADPPYNAGAAKWDEGFEWQHDWLNEIADVVAVTPGIGSLFDFAEITDLPYQWSVACWIANGRARGKMGYGNWVHVAIFSEESVHRNSQDIVKVTIKESEKDESYHRGRKFPKLMTWLFERYCGEGETVVDPFLGSGTTLLAAESTDRRCIGAEIEPEFCEEIIARWQEMTGDKAEVV